MGALRKLEKKLFRIVSAVGTHSSIISYALTMSYDAIHMLDSYLNEQ